MRVEQDLRGGGGVRAAEADICVLLNPGSGKGPDAEEARVAAVSKALARYPGRFDLRMLEPGGDVTQATRAACDAGFATIVAAGGDGTVSGVAGVVAGSGLRFGVLPLGTFNYFARAHGLPDDLDAAVDVLAAGDLREIGIGSVNGVHFVNNASLGAYPVILERRETLYRVWGRSRIAAYWSVLRTLMRPGRPRTLRITVDGTVHRMRAPLVFVMCNSYQLREFGLPGEDCVDADGLAVFIAPDCSWPGLLRHAVRLAAGRVEVGRDFALLCGRDVLVETRARRSLVARDGERGRMESPFRFRAEPGTLRLLVPREVATAGDP